MASRDITKCVPYLVRKYAELNQKCMLKGLQILLTCTARDQKEQIALYAQGRDSLALVNEKRRVAFLPPITQKQNVKVTWTLDSLHVVSPARPLAEAFDFVVVKAGAAIWDVKADVNGDHIPDYQQVAQIGREIGLVCGADFKPSPDYPHMQVPPNYKGVAV
jgi:hypothetical protein